MEEGCVLVYFYIYTEKEKINHNAKNTFQVLSVAVRAKVWET